MAIRIQRGNRRLQNRLRLAALFIIYPIYKTIVAILQHDKTMAIIMGALVILYAGVLIYVNSRLKRPTQVRTPPDTPPHTDVK